MGSTLTSPTTFSQLLVDKDQRQGDGSLTVEGAFALAGINILPGVTASIADNAAVSFDLPAETGLLAVWTADGESDTAGIYTFKYTATAKIEAIVEGTAMTPATGALAGTTGVDTDLTVSVHTDGKAYIENRRGAAVIVKYLVIA